MPIDKSEVLEILSLQDSLADTAEDVCKIMTLKKLPFKDEFREEFDEFVKLKRPTHLTSFASIMGQLDELIEAGFGGSEGEKDFARWLTMSRLLNTRLTWSR